MNVLSNLTSTTTVKGSNDSSDFEDGIPSSIVIKVDSPSPAHQLPGSGSEEALLNRSSVLFVAVSFILLMVISLAWLVFYYIQRFRYLHSKERVSRRLAELAKKAVARIPVKTLHSGDKEINLECEQCAICIEQFRPLDIVRILPCRHYFHKLCIDPWLLEQRSCPMCKLDILQAYGMRTDGFCAYSHQEHMGALRPTSSGNGATSVECEANRPAPSGSGSASGSDDGIILERIALVHPTPTPPPLTYVVLTTTTATKSAHPSPLTRPVVPTAGTIYYMQNSDTSITAPYFPATASTLPSDCSHTIIPLTNPIFVSVLPGCSTTSSQSPTPSVPSQEPSVGNLLLWNSQTQRGSNTRIHSSTCLSLSYRQHLPSHCDQPSSTSTTSTIRAMCDITSTTQAFTGPVCSVLTDDISVDPKALLREPLIVTTSHPSPGQPSSRSVDSVYLISRDPPSITQPSAHVPLTHSTPRHRNGQTGLLTKLTHPLLTKVNHRSAFFSWLPARWRPWTTTTTAHQTSTKLSSSTCYAAPPFLPPDRIISHTQNGMERTLVNPVSILPAPISNTQDPAPPPVGSQSVVVAVVEAFPSPTDSSHEDHSETLINQHPPSTANDMQPPENC